MLKLLLESVELKKTALNLIDCLDDAGIKASYAEERLQVDDDYQAKLVVVNVEPSKELEQLIMNNYLKLTGREMTRDNKVGLHGSKIVFRYVVDSVYEVARDAKSIAPTSATRVCDLSFLAKALEHPTLSGIATLLWSTR